MGKVISFFKNTILSYDNVDTEAELLLKVIDSELKRIRFIMSISKIANSDKEMYYFIKAKTIFRNLKKTLIRVDNNITDTLNNLDYKQLEFLLSAFQIEADVLENKGIEISLELQDTYLKLVTIYIEKTRNIKDYELNYYMYLQNSPFEGLIL